MRRGEVEEDDWNGGEEPRVEGGIVEDGLEACLRCEKEKGVFLRVVWRAVCDLQKKEERNVLFESGWDCRIVCKRAGK